MTLDTNSEPGSPVTGMKLPRVEETQMRMRAYNLNKRAAKVRLLVIVCLVTASVVGCATRSSRQLMVDEIRLKQVAAAKEVEKKNKRAVTDQEKRAIEIRRRREELAASKARSMEIERAGDLVRGGAHDAAIDLISKIFLQNEEILAQKAAEQSAKLASDASEATGHSPDATVESEDTANDAAPPELAEGDVTPPLPAPLLPREAAVAYLYRGTAYYQKGELKLAISDYQEALKLDRGLRAARLNLARLYFSDRQFSEAASMWKKDLAEGFRSGETLYLLAQCYFEIWRESGSVGELEAARMAIRGALVEKPEDKAIVRWLGLLEFQTQRYDEAIRIFKQILRSAPLDTEYLGLLARCYLDTEQYEEAVDTLEILVRAEKDVEARKSYYRTIGDLYGVLELPERAAEWYTKAQSNIEEVSAEERYSIGLLYADAGMGNEAIEWLGSLKSEDEKYPESLRRIGFLHRDRGETAEALEAFQSCRKANPRMATVHLVVGDMLFDAKEFKAAQAAYSDAQGFDKTRADGLAGLAECFYEERNLKMAVRYYEKAIADRPEDRRFRVALDQIKVELEIEQQSDEQVAQ